MGGHDHFRRSLPLLVIYAPYGRRYTYGIEVMSIRT